MDRKGKAEADKKRESEEKEGWKRGKMEKEKKKECKRKKEEK